MGNQINTVTDPESPLQIICSKFPKEAERLNNFSGTLNKKLGSKLWPEGGVGTLEGIRYIEKIIWRNSQSETAKELIGLWTQYYEGLREPTEAAIMANWQEAALKLGIELKDDEGNKKLWIP